jgi:hypothetical protein
MQKDEQLQQPCVHVRMFPCSSAWIFFIHVSAAQLNCILLMPLALLLICLLLLLCCCCCCSLTRNLLCPAGASVQQLARLAGHPHIRNSQQAGETEHKNTRVCREAYARGQAERPAMAACFLHVERLLRGLLCRGGLGDA